MQISVLNTLHFCILTKHYIFNADICPKHGSAIEQSMVAIRKKKISLGHGGGGARTHNVIAHLIDILKSGSLTD